MAAVNLAETEDLLTPLLLAAVDDTNEAPWMTMPEYQSLVIALLAGILRLHNRRQHLGWHVSTELCVSMPRPEGRGTLTLGPDQGVLRSRALGGLGLVVAEPPWLRVVDDQGRRLPSPEEEAERAERAAKAEAEAARLRAQLEGRTS